MATCEVCGRPEADSLGRYIDGMHTKPPMFCGVKVGGEEPRVECPTLGYERERAARVAAEEKLRAAEEAHEADWSRELVETNGLRARVLAAEERAAKAEQERDEAQAKAAEYDKWKDGRGTEAGWRATVTTIRPCRECGVLMIGGPTFCVGCGRKPAPAAQEPAAGTEEGPHGNG